MKGGIGNDYAEDPQSFIDYQKMKRVYLISDMKNKIDSIKI